jgi:hypothetical protein
VLPQASLRGGVIVRMYEHKGAHLQPQSSIRWIASILGRPVGGAA